MPRRMRSPFGLSLTRWQIWLLYAVVHSLGVAAGISMMIRVPSAAALWPPVGTLVAFLLIYPTTLWPSLIALAIVSECVVTFVFTPGVTPTTSIVITLLDVGQGVLAAFLFRSFIGERPTLTRVRPVVMMTLCFAAAAFIGSLPGAYVITGELFTRSFWMNQQTWWLGGYLATMVFVPLIASWARFGFRPFGDPPPHAIVLTVTQFAALAGVLAYVFSRNTLAARSVLDSPSLVYPALLWIALDGGPRRLMMGLLLTVVVAVVCTVEGIGPFTALPGPYTPVLILQGFMALALIPVVVVHAVTSERKNAMARIRASDARYRAFVAQSSEAIFRLEFSRPMPVALRAEDRRAWIRRNVYLAESNDTFRAASPRVEGKSSTNPIVPTWLHAGLDALADINIPGEHLRDFECVLPAPGGQDRTLLVSLTPVVSGAVLRRVWGAARDVSHMRTVQRELERQEFELRALATELTLTEERTRRRIAADLHDGIAQSLVGMQMHVAALRRAAKSQDENDDAAGLELALGDAITQIRTLMTELLPPGLYDQGIVAGLQWLADRFGEREQVRVQFVDDGAPKTLDEPITVLLFQTARQLLQNVARHAHTSEVRVRLATSGERVILEVEDSGVGFDTSQLTFLPSRRGGFGLFSIRERIKMIGGVLEIESVPGRGTRVRVTTPLRLETGPFDEALRA